MWLFGSEWLGNERAVSACTLISIFICSSVSYPCLRTHVGAGVSVGAGVQAWSSTRAVCELAVMAQAFKPSTWKAEADGSLSSRVARAA